MSARRPMRLRIRARFVDDTAPSNSPQERVFVIDFDPHDGRPNIRGEWEGKLDAAKCVATVVGPENPGAKIDLEVSVSHAD